MNYNFFKKYTSDLYNFILRADNIDKITEQKEK